MVLQMRGSSILLLLGRRRRGAGFSASSGRAIQSSLDLRGGGVPLLRGGGGLGLGGGGALKGSSARGLGVLRLLGALLLLGGCIGSRFGGGGCLLDARGGGASHG